MNKMELLTNSYIRLVPGYALNYHRAAHKSGYAALASCVTKVIYKTGMLQQLNDLDILMEPQHTIKKI
jgi:hypothetical protein